MIKNILTELSKKPKSFIIDFIKNCSIEEKIDAHYVTIEILTKNTVRILKSNGKPLDRVDLILNNMWGKLVTDWNIIRITNQEWFNIHIGYKIHMFYFPVNKPISIEYNDDIHYLIDRITLNDSIINKYEFINGLPDNTIKRFGIYVKDTLIKKNNISVSNYEFTKDYFISLLDANNVLFAKNEPEGYIFKWKKNIYQLVLSAPEPIISEKTSYEYLLCDFIKYCQSNNYIEKINSNYIKTVCNLFNDYILNYEEHTNNIRENIDPDAIKNPYLGNYNDIGFEYIPDNITTQICKDPLYKNIYKVLLANLRKGKDNTKCIYMNNMQVDEWNTIIKNIKVRTVN